MKNSRHITAFYLEMLLLMLVVIGIVLVLTNVFALSRAESAEARSLTDAVCLAQNAAEAVSASKSPEELCALLDENGNVSLVEGADKPTVLALYDGDMRPDASGSVVVRIVWDESAAASGSLARCGVTVTDTESSREIYSLETAVFIKEGER